MAKGAEVYVYMKIGAHVVVSLSRGYIRKFHVIHDGCRVLYKVETLGGKNGNQRANDIVAWNIAIGQSLCTNDKHRLTLTFYMQCQFVS